MKRTPFPDRLRLDLYDGSADFGAIMRAGDIALADALLKDKGVAFVVTRPFRYIDPDGDEWTVPFGTVTDGASIPWWLHSVVGPPVAAGYLRGAVVHDWLYHDQITTRAKADTLLYQATRDCNVAFWKPPVMYAGVRVGGAGPWEENRLILKGASRE